MLSYAHFLIPMLSRLRASEPAGEIPSEVEGADRSLAVAEARADVAQLVEHSLGKGEVTSSILVIGSRVSGTRREPEDGFGRFGFGEERIANSGFCGSNSVVESQPSKLLVAGSIPVSRSRRSRNRVISKGKRLNYEIRQLRNYQIVSPM